MTYTYECPVCHHQRDIFRSVATRDFPVFCIHENETTWEQVPMRRKLVAPTLITRRFVDEPHVKYAAGFDEATRKENFREHDRLCQKNHDDLTGSPAPDVDSVPSLTELHHAIHG